MTATPLPHLDVNHGNHRLETPFTLLKRPANGSGKTGSGHDCICRAYLNPPDRLLNILTNIRSVIGPPLPLCISASMAFFTPALTIGEGMISSAEYKDSLDRFWGTKVSKNCSDCSKPPINAGPLSQPEFFGMLKGVFNGYLP